MDTDRKIKRGMVCVCVFVTKRPHKTGHIFWYYSREFWVEVKIHLLLNAFYMVQSTILLCTLNSNGLLKRGRRDEKVEWIKGISIAKKSHWWVYGNQVTNSINYIVPLVFRLVLFKLDKCTVWHIISFYLKDFSHDINPIFITLMKLSIS